MSQQTWIAVGLLVGFIMFVTMRGELDDYLNIIGFNNAGTTGTTSSASTIANPSTTGTTGTTG